MAVNGRRCDNPGQSDGTLIAIGKVDTSFRAVLVTVIELVSNKEAVDARLSNFRPSEEIGMLTIWNEFARLVSDAGPAFALGLMLSTGVQWLVERSHWAARALSCVAQSVPGAALAGAALPGCSMTTVPLAIPLKRQGAGDGPLLAFIITSSLLGPASIVLTFTMFGPVWGVLRVALPLIAVCGLGWGLQRFGRKLHSEGEDIDEASCFSACGCGGGDSGCSSGEARSFWASLLR
jgi:uncharacterized membrane protein YraQ (UPF0718 family)